MTGRLAVALATVSLPVLSGCAAPAAEEEPAATPAPSVSPEAPPAEPFAYSAVVGSGDPSDQEAPVTVAATRLIVPSLNIDMAVTPEGVEDDGYMSIPEDVRTAGWYQYGAEPASAAGSTVVAAHVDDPVQGVGPFSRLRDTEVGAEAQVVDANGVTHTYRVVSVERISKAEVPLDRVFTLDGDPHLVLVTCGGAFDREARSYTDNYIVTAEKVS